jgi:predicted PurR-regulated permease PerM
MTLTPWQPPSQARVVLQVVLGVAAAAVGIWVLYRLQRVFFLLILTTFFAYLVAPLVRIAERPVRISGTERSLPRGLAIGVVYLSMLAACAAGAMLLLPGVTRQMKDAVARAPAYAESLRVWEQRWVRSYDRTRMPIEVRQRIDRSVVGTADAAVEYGRGSAMRLAESLSYLPWLVLIPILGVFVLKDAPIFRRAILTMLPHRFRLRGRLLFDDVNTTLATYVRGQLLACMFIGTMCGVGFAVLGVPYPALLGILAGILEFVPLVGPFLCAVAATIVAALNAPVTAVWVIGFLIALRLIQDYAIYPRLVGRGLRLHPLAVIVAVLAGLELDGVVGMFLAVPVVAIGSLVYRHWREWRRHDGVGEDALLRVGVLAGVRTDDVHA